MRTMKLLSSCLLALCVSGLAQGQYGDISDLTLNKPEDKVDVKSEPPPKGAIILFDGKSLDNWTTLDRKGKPPWKLLDGGVMEVNKENIISKEKFGDHFKLHVEFRVPYLPTKKGQERGNSGVYVQGRYEVQVLDSYGLNSKIDDCGAIYGIAAPKVNACKAPTVWQSYDIEFTTPKCKNDKKVENGRMTVHQNGVLIHDNVEITKDNTTAGLGGEVCKPGPIMLQDHGSPVQYRDIWVVQLK
ncbi:MAG: DUF1080 domain-containing protein [Gemmataceae bacterium]